MKTIEVTQLQVCDSNDPYHTMFVASQTTEGKLYSIVVVDPDDSREDWICSCPGWQYRGQCKHLELVTPCHWTEHDEEQTTEDQERDNICPRCGQSTHEELEL